MNKTQVELLIDSMENMRRSIDKLSIEIKELKDKYAEISLK